jgi:hypothetical protein
LEEEEEEEVAVVWPTLRNPRTSRISLLGTLVNKRENKVEDSR